MSKILVFCGALLAVGALAPFGASSTTGQLATQYVELEANGRVLERHVEPAMPTLGEPFEVHMALRVQPSVVAFLTDTLLTVDDVESVRPGRWSQEVAPGDSVDLRAVYRVIGFREGVLELPWLEVWLRGPRAAEPGTGAIVGNVADATRNERSLLQSRIVRLGEVEVGPFAPVAGQEGDRTPRPAADVLGGERSLWRILAEGVVALTFLAGLGGIVFRRPKDKGAARIAKDREIALRRLDWIRSQGWHHDGRVNAFYQASTETFRQFAARIEPEWNPTLTSSELLSRLGEQQASRSLESLASAVWTAERVKFGRLRPDGETAESDWAKLRDWIRDVPPA